MPHVIIHGSQALGTREITPRRRVSPIRVIRHLAGASVGEKQSGETAFVSRPVPKTHGTAALAALFDQRDAPAQEQIVDADWEDLEVGSHVYSIEERLETALDAAPIARLRLQHENVEQQSARAATRAARSPFHQELSSLHQVYQQADDKIITGTAVAVPEANVETGGSEADSADHLKAEASSALRTLARVVIAFTGKTGDWVEGWFEQLTAKGLFTPRALKETSQTPGDLQVSAWRHQQRRKARNKMTPLRFVGWLAWGSSIIGVVACGIIFRTDIMKTWPQTVPAYSTLGLPLAASPLMLKDLEQRYALSDKGEVIELRGVIHNTGEVPTTKPLVRADAVDSEGKLLTSWVFKLDGPAQLRSQMELPFLIRTLAPEGVSMLEVRVVTADEQAALELQGLDKFETVGEDNGFYIQRTMGGGWDEGQ